MRFAGRAERLYAAEMDAGATLAGLAAQSSGGGVAETDSRSLGRAFEPPGAALDGCPAVLWRENTAKLFVGDAGSATAPHVDVVGKVCLAAAPVENHKGGFRSSLGEKLVSSQFL